MKIKKGVPLKGVLFHDDRGWMVKFEAESQALNNDVVMTIPLAEFDVPDFELVDKLFRSEIEFHLVKNRTFKPQKLEARILKQTDADIETWRLIYKHYRSSEFKGTCFINFLQHYYAPPIKR